MIDYFLADTEIKERLVEVFSQQITMSSMAEFNSVYTYTTAALWVFFNVALAINMVTAVWHGVAVWVYAVVVAPVIYHISLTYKGA